MRFALEPFKDADGEAYCNICWQAFGNDLMGLLYPQGYTRAARDWSMNNLLEERTKRPDEVVVKTIIDHDLPEDDVNGKIVGIAWWRVFPKQRSDAELAAADKEEEEQGFPPDCNRPLLEDFHTKAGNYRREKLGGDPYVLLAVLAVLPQYQRKGVGSRLLDDGLAIADELSLPSYLEASPAGRPLYARKGYEQVREFEFSARAWGLDHDIPHVCMLRPAKGKVEEKR